MSEGSIVAFLLARAERQRVELAGQVGEEDSEGDAFVSGYGALIDDLREWISDWDDLDRPRVSTDY